MLQLYSLICSGNFLVVSSAPPHWWWTWASGLLLGLQLWLGTYSMGFWLFFSPGYFALWDSKTPRRPTCERVSYCVETSPPSRFPPQDRSLSLTLLSLFSFCIFCPSSFQREWAAFLGAWFALPAFRSCFVKVAQHSNDLLINLLGRKWSPPPIPPPSWHCPRVLAIWKRIMKPGALHFLILNYYKDLLK